MEQKSSHAGIKVYETCSVCKCTLRSDRVVRHMYLQHGVVRDVNEVFDILNNPTIKKRRKVPCQICNKQFKITDLFMHYIKMHKCWNKTELRKLFKARLANKPNISSAEAKELMRARKEINLNIKDRLSPEDGGMGRFGVPQDKYRYGYYGSGIWRKGRRKK